MMEDRLKVCKCSCDCGTIIVIDEQLLQERQMWKEKYLCLQRQMSKDIGQMKQTIFTECSNLMQQQLQTKEKEYTKLTNRKNTQIQQLTSKIISLETSLKIINRERQIQHQKICSLQEQIQEKDRLISQMKKLNLKTQHNWNDKLEDDMINFRKKIIDQNKNMIELIETENQHLKHKIKDFQKKYQILIPEVERLRTSLKDKCSVFDNLQQKHERLKRDMQKQLNNALIQREQIQKKHSSCRGEILKLNQKILQLQLQIREQKKIKHEVKVEPVYIEKPVHVERIVQKIIPVEKVVKEYLQPINYRDEELEHEYNKLKLQNDRIIKENSILERTIQQTINNYEMSISEYKNQISEYKSNISKYKAERELLAKKIQQLNKELDIVYSLKRVQNFQRQSIEPQKIKVYLKNERNSDYYSTGTEIQRVITVSSPRTLERSTSRDTSKTKPLLASPSSKRVIWK